LRASSMRLRRSLMCSKSSSRKSKTDTPHGAT
jgi:hypothetical protein